MKKLFTNTTNSPIYVGGVMVPPGEMVMVEVAGEPTAAEVEHKPTLAEQVALLLESSVAELVKSLDSLNDDTLEMMAALESGAEKPRSTLLAALSDEKIKRADAALANSNL